MINEGVLQRELKIKEFQKKINEVGFSVTVTQFMLLFYRNFFLYHIRVWKTSNFYEPSLQSRLQLLQ